MAINVNELSTREGGARCEGPSKKRAERSSGAERFVKRKKALVSSPPRWSSRRVTELDDSFLRAEVEEPSSMVEARATKGV